jgi:hypothetical protein
MCKWGNIWGDTKGIIGGILRNIQWEYLGNIQEIVRGNTKGIIGGIIREYCLIECKTPYLLLFTFGTFDSFLEFNMAGHTNLGLFIIITPTDSQFGRNQMYQR